MVFIPRTYPKAAGLQSEISKLAVTKIAHLENGYRRQVQIARFDMKRNLREIKHTRNMLHRAMRHYTKKLNEYKKAKGNRYYRELLHERRAKQQKHGLTPIPTPVSDNPKDNQANSSAKDIVTSDQKVPNENSDHAKEDDINNNYNHSTHVNIETQPFKDDEIQSQIPPTLLSSRHLDKTQGQQSDKPDVKDDIEKAGKLELSRIPSLADSKTGLSNSRVTRPVRKHRTGVSHVDIIKLQYCTNTRYLFQAVDSLAMVHGVNPAARGKVQAQESGLKPFTSSVNNKKNTNNKPSEYIHSNTRQPKPFISKGSSNFGLTDEDPIYVPSRRFKSIGTKLTTTRLDMQRKEPHVSTGQIRLPPASVSNLPELPPPSVSNWPHLLLPRVTKQRQPNKTRGRSRFTLPPIYTESLQRKASVDDVHDIPWMTAFSKLKHVHFIDTRDI